MPKSNSSYRRSLFAKRRRGAIAVFASLVLIVMLAFVAFGVDVGVVSLKRTEHQAAADAASLAGAAALYDDKGRLQVDSATQTASDFFTRNADEGDPTVFIGKWENGAFVQTNDKPNSVQVVTAGQPPLFFGQFLKQSQTFDVAAQAVALTNAKPETKTTTRVTRREYVPGRCSYDNVTRNVTVTVAGTGPTKLTLVD
ncbi:MAG: hypothetical protein H8E66_20740 [Planctomycetes bacterium]|nr:hypothetical protein [Planctomycetota bacterium]